MKKHFLLVLAISSLMATFAQPKDAIYISGIIRDHEGIAVPGASVKVKGDIYGTITDSAGVFRLMVPKLPISLAISHASFENQDVTASNGTQLTINLIPAINILEGVVLASKGIPTRILDAAFTADLIGQARIRQLPTTSIYDATVYSKGVDHTSSSLTMKTPSTRGFNGSGSTRVNQLVDGMDNQAPGLNFFVGNFNGPTELDIESVELLPGASSALYGPGGMNGTILINSKSPFKYKGLSVQARQGIMHVDKSQRNKVTPYYDYSLRWAESINNKLAFKIGAQYISATDWLANDSTNYSRMGTDGKLIPGTRATDPNYDGVNVYGDETSRDLRNLNIGNGQVIDLWYMVGQGIKSQVPPNFAPAIDAVLALTPSKLPISRTGYQEIDVIDPKTKNIKLSGALHYKLSDKLEAILAANWSTGNTVYTDDNRYALKGIKIGQYKAELKHKNWFWRTYTTQEDAGEAYSATVTTRYFNEAWKPSGTWFQQYAQGYIIPAATLWGEVFTNALTNGQSQANAVNAANSAVLAKASDFHMAGRSAADIGRPAPGSTQFRQLFDSVRSVPIPKGGLFKEKSQLWMSEGQYNFSNWKFAEVIVGGSYKKYVLDSDGTIFIDTAKSISINEIGAYVQVTKKLLHDKLVLTASGRYDKNENFKGKFTPRVAALIKVAPDHNIRVSYQTAYRFPSNLTQWIRLDVGSDFLLLGGLPWVKDYMQVDKYPVHEFVDGIVEPEPYEFKEFKPETMRSVEIGYKCLIDKKLLIDAYGYFGKYEDFVGRIGLYQPATNEFYSIVVNSANKVKTYGFGLGLDYRMQGNYNLFFNAYSDKITDVPSGFKSYFNTPEYRMNAGFGNSGLGKKQRIGFNVMMRWQDAFNWEGELANGPLKAFTTVDAQVSYKFPAIKTLFRLGGTNILNKYYKNAYGNPSFGGLYYASLVYNL